MVGGERASSMTATTRAVAVLGAVQMRRRALQAPSVEGRRSHSAALGGLVLDTPGDRSGHKRHVGRLRFVIGALNRGDDVVGELSADHSPTSIAGQRDTIQRTTAAAPASARFNWSDASAAEEM